MQHRVRCSVAASLVALVLAGCGGAPGPAASAGRAPATGVPAPADPGLGASVEPAPTAPPGGRGGAGGAGGGAEDGGRGPAQALSLPASGRFVAERVLDARVLFLAPGEGDRLAVLADDGGVILPHRLENGAWQALPLPASARSMTGQASLGIYFGRDNRPRLMGHRTDGSSRRMVYLRHRDGAWQDQRSEIGALAGDGSILFGELGEADPEVVCKVGSICLLKSRKGWKELPNTLPETAVVRAFAGKGYALTADGVLVAGDDGFTRVGPAGPWTSEATGFRVGADGAVTVVEPRVNLVHHLDAPAGAWRTSPSPVVGPRDVAGDAGDRWIAGDGGLAHEEGGTFARVGDPTWSLSRIVVAKRGVVAGGPSGVVFVTARRAP